MKNIFKNNGLTSYLLTCLLIAVNICCPDKMHANDTLSISQCHNIAINSFPEAKQKVYLEQQHKLTTKNIKNEWLPKIDMNGQATYQSDIIDFSSLMETENTGGTMPLNLNFPDVPHDQYKVTLDINQVIYDGGSIEASKELNHEQTNLKKQEIEVSLHQLKSRINEIFFSALIIQKNIEITNLIINELIEKKEVIHSGVENGVLLASDLQKIEAEILKTEQKIEALKINKKASFKILSHLMDTVIPNSTHLSAPTLSSIVYNNKIKRPEIKMFEIQKNTLDANEDKLKSDKMPKLFAFGQAGYGKPGLNMINDEFNSFYIVGAKLSWNIWDWQKTKRKRENLIIQRNIIKTKQETFNKNIQIQLENQSGLIEQYEKAIQKDKKILKLRQQISKSAESRLNNGVITTTEYLNEINEEKRAKIKLETDKLLLQKAKTEYLTIKGTI